MSHFLRTLKMSFCVALFASPALAIDWAGFYSGIHAGYQFGRSQSQTGDLGYNSDNQEWKYGESGFNGGIHFGYNYRAYSLIVGPELDLGYLKLSGSGAQPDSPGDDTVASSSSDFYTSLRARIGMEQGNWLFYATGGLMGINFSKHIVDNCSVAPCGGSTVDASARDFHLGYTIGAGAEYGLDRSWAVKLEYLYFSLASKGLSAETNLGVSYDWTAKAAGHIVRAGIAFHFGEPEAATPAPQPVAEKSPEPQVQVTSQEPEPAQVANVKKSEDGLMLTLQGDVLFKSGKWELNDQSKAALSKVAEQLNKETHHTLLIQGHTDSAGKDSWNKLLSERRANAVKNFLIQNGFEKKKITATGLGSERSIAGNETPEGRAKNRRVEIFIQKTEP